MAYNESLEYYVEHFKTKGFTEEALNIDKEPRSIERELRAAFAHYLREAKDKGEEIGVVLEVPAVFKKDEAKFNFIFIVNPAKETIRLRKIHSKLGDVLDKIVTFDGQIPSGPEQLYNRLLHLKSQNLHEFIQKTPERSTRQKKNL